MILVKAAPEPLDFNEKVRKPGLDAIAELVGEKPDRTRRGRKREKVADRREDIPSKRFPPFWRNILPEMLEAYESRCAYLALHIEHSTGNPTVDHFIPQSKDWRQVYEWRNYRLAAGLINSKKRELDISLDPFEIEPGWFALEFDAFQVMPGPGAKGKIAERVDDTIEKLGLNREECCKERQEYVDAYRDVEDPIPFSYLSRRAPLIASELSRQGLLREGDA